MAIRKPKYYKPEPGDEFVAIGDIRPIHLTRIFEARNQNDGTGILGKLADANHYLLHGTVGLRFEGEPLGFFDVPEAKILLKHEGFELPEADTTSHDSVSTRDNQS